MCCSAASAATAGYTTCHLPPTRLILLLLPLLPLLSLRVQVPKNQILNQNQNHNYYYPKHKYLIIGYLDPLGSPCHSCFVVIKIKASGFGVYSNVLGYYFIYCWGLGNSYPKAQNSPKASYSIVLRALGLL